MNDSDRLGDETVRMQNITHRTRHADMFFYSIVFISLISLGIMLISVRTGNMIFINTYATLINIAVCGAAFYYGFRGEK